MNTGPNFTERIAGLKRVAGKLRALANQGFDFEGSMQDVAEDLHNAAEVVLAEALRMEASAKRFEARRAAFPHRQSTKTSR